MPPRPKFTKEKVLEAAMEILRADGIDALTARSLSAALGCSTRPLFTLWDSMDELKQELYLGPVAKCFDDYCNGFGEYTPAFKRYGLMLVGFAEDEPNVFSFMFLSRHGETPRVEQWADSALGEAARAVLIRDYALDEATARILFTEVWIHAFGLCVLKSTGAALLTQEEVSNSLSRSFISLLSLARAGRLGDEGITPLKKEKPGGFDISKVPVIKIDSTDEEADE